MNLRAKLEGIQKALVEEKTLQIHKFPLPEIKDESLTLKMRHDSTDKEEVFYVIGTLFVGNGVQGDLAVTFSITEDKSQPSYNLVVVKKLIDENEQEKAEDSIRRFHNKDYPFASHPNIYKPALYNAGRNQWAGLDNAYAVVYPYISGISLVDHFKNLRNDNDALKKLLEIFLQICRAGRHIEEHNSRIPSHNSLLGIWDFNITNFLVQNSNQIMLFDYTNMENPAYNTFPSIVCRGLAIAAGVEEKENTPLTSTYCDKILGSDKFKKLSFQCKKLLKQIILSKSENFADLEKQLIKINSFLRLALSINFFIKFKTKRATSPNSSEIAELKTSNAA